MGKPTRTERRRAAPLYQVIATYANSARRTILVDAGLNENRFQQLLVNVARGDGWIVGHFRRSTVGHDAYGRPRTATATSFDAAGYPDLTLSRPTSPEWQCWAEVKDLFGTLDPPQRMWRDALLDPARPLPNGAPRWQLWCPKPESLTLAFATILGVNVSQIEIKEHG